MNKQALTGSAGVAVRGRWKALDADLNADSKKNVPFLQKTSTNGVVDHFHLALIAPFKSGLQ